MVWKLCSAKRQESNTENISLLWELPFFFFFFFLEVLKNYLEAWSTFNTQILSRILSSEYNCSHLVMTSCVRLLEKQVRGSMLVKRQLRLDCSISSLILSWQSFSRASSCFLWLSDTSHLGPLGFGSDVVALDIRDTIHPLLLWQTVITPTVLGTTPLVPIFVASNKARIFNLRQVSALR